MVVVEPQFPGPVGECPAESFHIGMASPERRFHFRYFLAAASDSLLSLPAFRGDFFEGSPVAVQLGGLAGERLPALHDHVHVLRV